MQPAQVLETHSAVVFFFGDRAYKVKKPVDLGFLDFRSVAARLAVCTEEVRLNRRLAPDVYLGVAEVRDPDGAVCDHLVVMRRMPIERRLATLVREGVDVDEPLRRVAQQLASMHAAGPRSDAAADAAGIPATRSRWVANTEALLQHVPSGILDGPAVATVHGLAMRYLDGRGDLFAQRIADGRAVDGHGDLLADDIFCLDDGPRILDCLEFDEGLRLGDGLADVAFLAMDLERLGRPDLAARFLDAYREFGADGWPASLAHHHIAYRSQVRAKVIAIRAAQGHEPSRRLAPELLRLAADHLERGRVRVVVVGGLPGTGKSTLAAALGAELGAVVLRSDEIRKELVGLDPTSPAPAAYGEGIYDAATTSRTYDVLLARARVAVERGELVVLDASWTDPATRARAHRIAAATHTDLIELECRVPAPLAAQRIADRQRRGGDPSDATAAIAGQMAEECAPWATAVPIDTTPAPELTLAEALRHVRVDLVDQDNGTRQHRSVPDG